MEQNLGTKASGVPGQNPCVPGKQMGPKQGCGGGLNKESSPSYPLKLTPKASKSSHSKGSASPQIESIQRVGGMDGVLWLLDVPG